MTEEFIKFLETEKMDKFIDLKVDLNGKHYLCVSCKLHLSKKKMPPLSFQNNLKVSEIPECLQSLTSLEKQLIKKNLPFLKVRKLPKTQMDVINDKVVNVPISDDDLIKNVNCLPRTKETNGFVNLKMKRQMKSKTYYKMETVRPDKVYNALLWLKENNPFYRVSGLRVI